MKQFDGYTDYLNFWPFFLGALETDHPRFKLTLKKLFAADSGMLTYYGVRSLASKILTIVLAKTIGPVLSG